MRRLLIDKLKKWQQQDPDSRKPLVVTGARQIGKTYLLKEFGAAEFPNYHYFNFEFDRKLHEIFEPNLKPQRIIQTLGLHSDRIINHNDLIIFDEIQACPLAITSLKYFCEDLPEQAVCVAGSLLGLELNPGSYPVGKIDYLNMFPMTFREFAEALGDEKVLSLVDECLAHKEKLPEFIHARLWERLKEYFIVGGMPEAVKAYKDLKDVDLKTRIERVREVQYNIVRSHMADMAKHSGEENSMHIEQLWHNIPTQLSQEIDSSVKRFQFKNIIPKINRYPELMGVIYWLNKANLIIRIPIAYSAQTPIKAYTKENIFKLYMYDIGILSSMVDLKPQSILDADYGTYKGFFAENFVAQELAAAQGSKEHLYSWKENSAEVEFILNQESGLIPLEVKSGLIVRAKSAKVFMKKYNSPYRITLSGQNINLDYEHKVMHYPLYLASSLVDN